MSLFEAGELYEMENMTTSILRQATLEELPLFTYETLANATENFHESNKLGKGGFGQVYKVMHIYKEQVICQLL